MLSNSCQRCRHWEPLSKDPDNRAGLCQRISLSESFDSWPITEVGDYCDEWVGVGFYRADDGSLYLDRRSTVRFTVDCPALLQIPSGNRTARIADVSETGARLRLSSPPRVGATALLNCGSHELFCHVAWATEDSCGVTFDHPISRTVVFEMTGRSEKPEPPVANPSNIPFGTKRRQSLTGLGSRL